MPLTMQHHDVCNKQRLHKHMNAEGVDTCADTSITGLHNQAASRSVWCTDYLTKDNLTRPSARGGYAASSARGGCAAPSTRRGRAGNTVQRASRNSNTPDAPSTTLSTTPKTPAPRLKPLLSVQQRMGTRMRAMKRKQKRIRGLSSICMRQAALLVNMRLVSLNLRVSLLILVRMRHTAGQGPKTHAYMMTLLLYMSCQ